WSERPKDNGHELMVKVVSNESCIRVLISFKGRRVSEPIVKMMTSCMIASLPYRAIWKARYHLEAKTGMMYPGTSSI
ncbi:hypothetical protein NPIL_496531, partial [Nephila pilipes]